jgi:hypothetical protein
MICLANRPLAETPPNRLFSRNADIVRGHEAFS